MDNDAIRTSGGNTLVEIWIDGKLRNVSVSPAAIEEALGLAPDKAAAMTDEGRCEFVRANLATVVAAAKERLRESPGAGSVLIDVGELSKRGGGAGERRRGDRRQGERRKAKLPATVLPQGERRRGERRKSTRRPKGG